MECTQKKYKIEKLVKMWQTTSALRRNVEYQRGEMWNPAQKKALIDSIFRHYPIPPLFLHRVEAEGLEEGQRSIVHDIVDGQQRILALSQYLNNEFALLHPDDKKLRLPMSLRKMDTPWAGKTYKELDPQLRHFLDSKEVDAFEITNVFNADEVRDLFIRLQSGTALSRQEIRDAWPGKIGPFIEHIAGKLNRLPQPKYDLFQIVDKRGTREDESRDNYCRGREFCAQLLRLFITREHDPCAAQGVGANELDALYHDYLNVDEKDETLVQFCKVLELATSVTTKARSGSKKKFPKLDVFALFLFLQDARKSPNFKPNIPVLAEHLVSDHKFGHTGRTTSGSSIKGHYEQWREKLPQNAGIRLDQNRGFNDDQKLEMYKIQKGVCPICKKVISKGDGEGDHWPVLYRDGGRTVVENGRLVHVECNPRGRPPAT